MDGRTEREEFAQLTTSLTSMLTNLCRVVLVRSLWWMVAVSEGILAADQVRALVARTLEQIAAQGLPPRRARTCARGLRRPVQSWPRLTAPSYQNGPTQQEVLPTKAV